MNPIIFDMRTIATQEALADEASQGFLSRLMDSLRSLPESSTDELRDRAAAYAGSQPSFAADLSAAADVPALA